MDQDQSDVAHPQAMEKVTMTDLVERLRQFTRAGAVVLVDMKTTSEMALLLANARDEIERLRAALDVVPGTVSDEVMEWAKPSFEAERALSTPEGRDDLNRAWETVNALGGYHDPEDQMARGYHNAITDALNAIEKLGGVDPLSAPEKEAGT